MFDSTVPLRYVQRNGNSRGHEQWAWCDIYAFYVRNLRTQALVKYIAEVKYYEGHFYRIDFYAKTEAQNRYMALTHHYMFGKVASALLSILHLVLKDPAAIVGIQAANLESEASEAFSKRFAVYHNILLATLPDNKTLLAQPELSRIFVYDQGLFENEEQTEYVLFGYGHYLED